MASNISLRLTTFLSDLCINGGGRIQIQALEIIELVRGMEELLLRLMARIAELTVELERTKALLDQTQEEMNERMYGDRQ